MRSADIHQETTGRWPSILMSLGVEERFLRNRHGACPICSDGKDRFRFDDKNGKGTFFCSKCGSGTGFDLLMQINGIDFKEALKRVRSVLPKTVMTSTKTKTRSDAQTKKILLDIWKSAKKIEPEDDAGQYLAWRGLTLPESNALRLHPGLEYRDHDGKIVGKFPCMVAAIVDKAGKCIALHRTWLQNGRKALVEQPKKSLGGFNAGSAIQLYKATHTLGVAEGIETAIAAHLRFKYPVWPLISASQMERFEWPSTIKRLLIFGDSDSNFTGQKAGYTLAYRAKAKGLDVHITFPELIDTDWADSFRI